MANQIVVSSGAKVRNLEGVLTGTSGVVSSVPLGAANGVATLDSGGKVPVSQLPSSVVTYLGTWNAATNTPYLVNGTGDAGDLYICNVAGTANFGAGPITFAVGDWVLYGSGTWQKSNGQNGTVTSVAASITGNSIGITGSPITTAGTLAFAFAGTNLQYVNGAGNLTTFPTLISSIGLSMPSAFSVSNSPLTSNGTIAVTGAGYPSQYIRGDGTLADFPTSGGGGSSVSYYLNGGTSQGSIGGVTYYQMSKTAVTSSGVDFAKSGDGLIVSFLTDAGDPAQLNIPSGNWNLEIYASMSSNGGTPELYAELYKYDGTIFTLISTSSNEILYDGVNLNLYTFAMTVPATTLTLTDRLAIKLYSTNSGGKTTTVHTQDSHLCQIITTFSTGITALNGLTAQVQYFATGTSGTDFGISSSTATHTFNLPTASATNRGALSSADWTTFNSKVGGSGSDGRVAFWNGASSLSSNANLYWDNSTSRLGICTNTPNASLGIVNSSSTGLQLRTSDTSNQYQANIYWDSSYGMVYGYNRIGAGTTAHNLTFYNALGGLISIPESSNNNIGFNTINPQGSSATTVYDFTSTSTSVELRLHNPTTGYTSTDGSYIKVTPTALVIGNDESSKSILVNNGGFGVVTIDGTNKVALGDIGVIPMTQQLTVVGSIQAYGGSIYQTVTSSMLKANSSGQIIAATGGTDYEYPLTFSSPLVRTTNTISIPAASASVSGYLTSTDWNTFNNKTTLPSLTSGSVLFSNGSTITQDNSNFYWNNTNKRLGIGYNAPESILHILGASATLIIDGNSSGTQTNAFLRLRTGGFNVGNFAYNLATDNIQISNVSGGSGGGVQIFGTGGSTTGLTIAAAGAATFSSSVTATTGTLSTTYNGGTTGMLHLTSSGTEGGAITLEKTSGTAQKYKIGCNSTNQFFIYNETAANQPLTITSGGNVGIGYTSNIGKLDINTGGNSNIVISNDSTDTGYNIVSLNGTRTKGSYAGLAGGGSADNNLYLNSGVGVIIQTGASFTEKMRISNAGVVTISALGSGAVTATSGVLSATSDMNLKISDGYIDTALDKILKLTPRYFYWKEETGLPTDLRQLGFYAQEVNEAIGEEGANTPRNENDKWGIYDRAIIAMLTKAMQEQNELIKDLKARLDNAGL